MSREDDCRALAKGCSYYKKKFEEVTEKNIKLESEIRTLQTQGYVVTTTTSAADVIDSPEFKEIQLKTKEYVAMSEKEKEQLSQESNVLLRSMTKLSAELSLTVESNASLMAENDSLKTRIQNMMDERMKEQSKSYDELLKDKDLTYESKMALDKANQLIQELKLQIEEQTKEVEGLTKYKGMYEEEHRKVIRLEDELDILRRSASKSTVVEDDTDDLLIMGDD